MTIYNKIAKLTLVLVYLVIIAGAVVRMTGSGMGCPDWPKCFGHYIPPTQQAQIEWQPNSTIKKGQIIIVNETLQVAKDTFTTSTNFNTNNWEPYTKHDYAKFNATHTWIEYINRLFGALAGVATLVLAFFSLRFRKTNLKLTLLSWLAVVALGFQGWLGATVVYSLLSPVKITIHMVMALLIVLLLLYLVFHSTQNATLKINVPKLKGLAISALVLTLIQIIFGTQVRQFVDEQVTAVGYDAKELWLLNPTFSFYIHRTFSILVVFINGLLTYLIVKNKLNTLKVNWIVILVAIEISTGILMYYFNFPFTTQSIHLVFAALLFGAQYYLVLQLLNTQKGNKTL